MRSPKSVRTAQSVGLLALFHLYVEKMDPGSPLAIDATRTLVPIAERGTCPFFEQRHLFELGHHIVIVLFAIALTRYRRISSGRPTGRYLQRGPSADFDPIARSRKLVHCVLVGILPQVDDSLVLSILLYFEHSLPLCYSSWGLKNSISSYWSFLIIAPPESSIGSLNFPSSSSSYTVSR